MPLPYSYTSLHYTELCTQRPCQNRCPNKRDRMLAGCPQCDCRRGKEVDDLSKLTLSNAQAIREVMQASVKMNCEPQFLHRLHCTLLIAEGRSCCEVARWFGKHPRTIERWVHALDLHGLEGLRDRHAGGRPAKLAGETARRLALDLQKAAQRIRISEVGMEWKASDVAPGRPLRNRVECTPMPTHASPAGARRANFCGLKAPLTRQEFCRQFAAARLHGHARGFAEIRM